MAGQRSHHQHVAEAMVDPLTPNFHNLGTSGTENILLGTAGTMKSKAESSVVAAPKAKMRQFSSAKD